MLKLGMSYPLPSQLIHDFAAGVQRLLVLEELDPFIEEQVRLMGIDLYRGVEEAGLARYRPGHKSIFPVGGELDPGVVRALHDAMKDAIQDPQHLAVLERFDMPVIYMNSEDYRASVARVIEDPTPPRLQFDPNHPLADARGACRHRIPVQVQAQDVVLHQARQHPAGAIAQGMFPVPQAAVYACIELRQWNIAVTLPVFAEKVIKTQVDQDPRIAAQVAGEVAAQLGDQRVTVGVGIHGAMQAHAALDVVRQLAPQRPLAVVPFQPPGDQALIRPGEVEMGEEIQCYSARYWAK
jgi:hypothetical protein